MFVITTETNHFILSRAVEKQVEQQREIMKVSVLGLLIGITESCMNKVKDIEALEDPKKKNQLNETELRPDSKLFVCFSIEILILLNHGKVSNRNTTGRPVSYFPVGQIGTNGQSVLQVGYISF